MKKKDHREQNARRTLGFLSNTGRWMALPLSLALLGLGALTYAPKAYGLAADAPTPTPTPLNCLQCHTKRLEFHDKLGSGNGSCLSCHDDSHQGSLLLADGTALALSDAAPLCGQCHQSRYRQWGDGTHGLPGTEGVACTKCHDPHRPQVALLNITEPHPVAAPAPPKLPTVPALPLAIGLSVIISGVIVAAWKHG